MTSKRNYNFINSNTSYLLNIWFFTTRKSNTSWNHQQPYTKKNDSSSCPGADPGFFSGGGAFVSCSTSTPINHIVFFLQNTVCIRKPQVISGGGAHPLHPPPRSAPVAKYLYRDIQFQILTILLQVQQTVECNLSNLQVDKKTNFLGVTELHRIFIMAHKVKNPTKQEANLFAIYIRARVN